MEQESENSPDESNQKTDVVKVWSIIQTLYRTNDLPILEAATKDLFQHSNDVVEQFLFQIAGLLLSKTMPDSFLEALLARIQNSLFLALQLHFIVSSQIEDNSDVSLRAQDLLSKVESACYQGGQTRVDSEAVFRCLTLSNQTHISNSDEVLLNMAAEISSFRNGVALKTQTRLLATYENVFIGTDAISWVLDNGYVTNRADAVACLQELMHRGLFASLDSYDTFVETSMFRFQATYTPKPLLHNYIYFSSELTLVRILEQISVYLKTIESTSLFDWTSAAQLKAERLRLLRSYLQRYNSQFLRNIVFESQHLESAKVPSGLALPHLPPWKGSLLAIDFGDAFCLTTKDRVPFMFFFEILADSPTRSKPRHSTGTQHKRVSIPVDSDLELQSSTDEWLLLQSDDSSAVELAYGELWSAREDRIRKKSAFGHLPNWSLEAAIVKTFDDLRQEQLCMQLIIVFKEIFEEAGLSLWLQPYHIIATSSSGGLVEVVKDAISLDVLMKQHPSSTLTDYFQATYPTPQSLRAAKQNFMRSLCAYSLVCYFLQIKDRHNGNILIHTEGFVIHIDYGFLLGTSPGNMMFEDAPFKVTPDWIELLEGAQSTFMQGNDNIMEGPPGTLLDGSLSFLIPRICSIVRHWFLCHPEKPRPSFTCYRVRSTPR